MAIEQLRAPGSFWKTVTSQTSQAKRLRLFFLSLHIIAHPKVPSQYFKAAVQKKRELKDRCE